MRLIDADELISNQDLHIVIGAGDNICIDIADIAKAPTAEAEEVVRCKGCMHYFHYGDGVYGCRTFGMMKTKPDGFCSYGERKDNERKAD